MPAGQVIGRVSVKVLPDTDDFRRDAEKKLNKIEKSLEVKVATRIDMSGASREMLEEVRKINQRNRQSDSRKIRFATKISTDGMREEISKAVRNLQARADTRKVKFDAILDGVIINAELDKESLEKVKKELEHWRRENSPVKVQVQPEMMPGAGAIVSARLGILTRPRTVPIIPELNNGAVAKVATALAALSGGRVVADWMRDMAESLGRMDKSAPLIGTIALAVAGIAGWAGTAASNLAAMSSSLAQIGPLAFTLPGIVGGLGIGLGVTAAALKDFNTVFPDVKGTLSDLQDVISENFWNEAQKPIRGLIDDVLPKLSAGMATTATEIGQWFGGLADSLRTSFNPLIDGMFADLGSSIDIFEKATPAIANIMAILSKTGAGQLPELAQWVGTITQRFSDFLTQADKTGDLDKWIETAKQNLSDLGRVLSNIGGIFAGISRAATAAGGSTLGMFADTLERVHKAIDSPGFQGGFTNFLITAHGMMDRIAKGAGPGLLHLIKSLADTFSIIGPIAGDAIGKLVGAISNALAQPAMQDGIVKLFEGISKAVDALAPALPPIAAALGAVLGVVGALLPVIANLVAAAFVPLANIITELAPKLEPIIAQLGGLLLSVVTALAPVIEELGKQLGKVLEHCGPLFDALQRLWDFIGPVLVPVLKILVKMLGDTLVMAIDGLTNVINGALDFIMGIWNVFAGLFTGDWDQMWNGIKQIVSGVWELIKGAFQLFFSVGLLGILGKGMGLLKGAFKAGWQEAKTLTGELLDSIIGRFKSFLSSLVESPGAAFSALKRLFSEVWGDIKTAARLAWDELPEIVRNTIGKVIDIVTFLPKKILGALGDLGKLLVDAGKALIQGLIDGITGMFGKVKGTLGNLTGKFKDWKGPAPLDRVLLVGAGQLIIEGLITGLESRYDAVRDSLSGLTKDIAGTQFDSPKVGAVGVGGAVDGALDSELVGAREVKILKYYAAPGSSLGSEEDLFAAASRTRMVGW